MTFSCCCIFLCFSRGRSNQQHYIIMSHWHAFSFWQSYFHAIKFISKFSLFLSFVLLLFSYLANPTFSHGTIELSALFQKWAKFELKRAFIWRNLWNCDYFGCRFGFVAFNLYFQGIVPSGPWANKRYAIKIISNRIQNTRNRSRLGTAAATTMVKRYLWKSIVIIISGIPTNYMLNTEMDSKQQHYCLYGRAFTN